MVSLLQLSMTDWNKKYVCMSLEVGGICIDTGCMAYRNGRQNSTARSISAVLLTGAIGPGYPVRSARSTIERRLHPAAWVVVPDDCDRYDTAPENGFDQRPKRQVVRRVLGWIRRHPGYAGGPSHEALDMINQVARTPRR